MAKRCPDDKTFADSLLAQPLYATAKRGTRLRIMLERLEESFEHKEPADVSPAQIEHIMPQTLTPEWVAELGEDAQEHHARLLHTIGNLTLTCYNPDLSNRPYSEKRALLKSSHFELNRRLDHQTYFKAIRVEQSHLECVVLDRILAAWLDEAVLIPGLFPAGLPPIAEWPHQWFWDGHEHVDPAKEATAQATRLANHTTTLADEYARRGQDWESQIRQRAKEMALLGELGLAPAAAQPTTSPAEEPADEEMEPADAA